MAQTLPNGIVVPNADGGEQISATGVQEMRTLGASVDGALADRPTTAVVDAKDAAVRFAKPTPDPFDFDTFKQPGTYAMGDPFPEGWVNVPDGITTASILTVYTSPNRTWCAQELIQYGNNPVRLWRVSSTTSLWNPWVQIGGGGDVSTAMGGNAARQTDFVNRTGGPVSTGGKAAFALRLDHGWTNIKSKLRAGLIARGIVPGVASCSRQWGLAENSGATIAEVKSWVANGEFEILNQGATHGQAMTNYVDEIVNGRAELESQLDTNVWGFAPPGESVDWEDFDGGRVDGWASLPAAIALASHAYSLGYVGGVRRVLDGTIRQGLSHITLDTYDMAQARAQVDAAISEGRGIQVMLHPRELDKSGKITTAAFLDFLDYVVAKRDAGDLVTLSPNELVLADSTRPPVTVPDVTGLADRLAALEYTSGWRDISTTLPGYVSGRAWIKRRGSMVWLDCYQLVVADQGTTWANLGNAIPAGFRMDTPGFAYLAVTPWGNTRASGPVRISSGGNLLVYGMGGKKPLDATVAWPTEEAIPSVLPGTPA